MARLTDAEKRKIMAELDKLDEQIEREREAELAAYGNVAKIAFSCLSFADMVFSAINGYPIDPHSGKEMNPFDD